MLSLYELPVASEQQKGMNVIIADVQTGLLQSRINNAIRVKVALNDQQLTTMQSLFPNRTVLQVDRAPLTFHEHPVLHALNDYAYDHMNIQLKSLPKGTPTLEIGGKAVTTCSHGDILIDNERDANRYVDQRQDQFISQYASGAINFTPCVQGAQNCQFIATHAFAINSIYDMSLDDIVAIFDQHRIEVMYAWAYFPLCLLDDELLAQDNRSGYYTVDQVGKYTYFYHGDGNFVYAHNTSTWAMHAKTVAIHSEHFTVIIESVEQHGIFHCMKYTRVRRDVKESLLLRPCLGALSLGAFYRVPKMVYYINRGCIDHIRDLPYHIIPKELVVKAVTYADRQLDGAYNYSSFSTTMGAALWPIIIGTKTVYTGAPFIDMVEFQDIVKSLYIICAVMRRHRGAELAKAFKTIQHTFDFGIIDNIVHTSKAFFQRGLQAVVEWVKSFLDINPVTIKHARLRLFEIEYASHRHRSTYPTVGLRYQPNAPRLNPSMKLDGPPPKTAFVKPPDNVSINSDSSDSISIISSSSDSSASMHVKFDHSTHSVTTDPSQGTVDLPAQIDPDDKFVCPEPFIQATFSLDFEHYYALNPSATTLVTCDRATFNTSTCPNRIMIFKDIHNNARGHLKHTHLWSDRRALSDPSRYKRNIRRDHPYTVEGVIAPKAGMCFLVACAHAMIVDKHYPIQNFDDAFSQLWVDCFASMNPDPNGIIPANQFNERKLGYFLHGQWDSVFLDHFILAFAALYQLTIEVNFADGTKQLVGHGSKRIIIHHRDNHYYFMKRGGADEKALHKWDKIITNIKDKEEWLDMSAAPGNATYYLRSKGAIVTPLVYIGKGALAPNVLDREGINYNKYHDWEHLDIEIFYDGILIDACDDTNKFDEQLSLMACHFIGRLRKGGRLILKQFETNQMILDQLKDVFDTVTDLPNKDYRHPDKTGASIEHFLICTGYKSLPIYYVRTVDVEINVALVDDYLSHGVDLDISKKLYDQFYGKVATVKKSFRVISGFAGCGKSYYYKHHVTNGKIMKKDCIVVCPTKELATADKGVTEHVYITHHRGIAGKNTVIDEAHAYHPGFYYFVPNGALLLGDPEQINNIHSNINILVSAGVPMDHRFTYRCPHDVADLAGQILDLTIQSRSKILKGITQGENVLGKIISFNRATAKENLSSTVHGTMGSTYKDVVIVVDKLAEDTGLLDNKSYLYVALTRASHRIMFRGDADLIQKYFFVGGAQVSEMAPQQDIMHNEVVTSGPVAPQAAFEEKPDQPVACMKASDIAAIYNAVIRPANQITDVVPFVKSPLAAPQDGKLKTDFWGLADTPITVTGFTITDAPSVLKSQPSNCLRETGACILTRYNGKTAPMTDKWCLDMCDTMYRRLAKSIFNDDKGHCINKGKSAVDCLDHVFQKIGLSRIGGSANTLVQHTFNYMESLRDKLPRNCSDAWASLQLDEPFEPEKIEVSFHMKAQNKFVADDGFDTSGKVGQGIAAYPKSFNTVFGPVWRAIMTEFETFLHNNGDEKYQTAQRHIIMSGAPEKDFSGMIAEYERSPKYGTLIRKMVHKCKDTRQWDSAYAKVNIMFECLMMCKAGLDPDFIDIYLIKRNSWKMSHRFSTKSIGFTVYGRAKQHSGGPGTFGGNTVNNMAMDATAFDYVQKEYSLWKGDDSNVKCMGMEKSKYFDALFKVTQHEIKMMTLPYGEFAGYFIGDYGIFPDIFRKVAKFLFKVYKSPEHLDEAKLSVAQDIACVPSEVAVCYGLRITAHHYQQIHGLTISESHLRQIWDFALLSSGIEFDHLVKYSKTSEGQ